MVGRSDSSESDAAGGNAPRGNVGPVDALLGVGQGEGECLNERTPLLSLLGQPVDAAALALAGGHKAACTTPATTSSPPITR